MQVFSKYVFLALLLAVTSACGQRAEQSEPAEPASFRDLNGNGTVDGYENPELSLEERAEDALSRLTLDDKTRLVMGTLASGTSAR